MKNARRLLPRHRRTPLRNAAALAAMLLLVSACGQRGPLYLPDESAPGNSADNGDERAEDPSSETQTGDKGEN